MGEIDNYCAIRATHRERGDSTPLRPLLRITASAADTRFQTLTPIGSDGSAGRGLRRILRRHTVPRLPDPNSVTTGLWPGEPGGFRLREDCASPPFKGSNARRVRSGHRAHRSGLESLLSRPKSRGHRNKRPALGSQAGGPCTQRSNPENEWNSDKLCASLSGMNSCIM
jgi:hypothetical protein